MTRRFSEIYHHVLNSNPPSAPHTHSDGDDERTFLTESTVEGWGGVPLEVNEESGHDFPALKKKGSCVFCTQGAQFNHMPLVLTLEHTQLKTRASDVVVSKSQGIVTRPIQCSKQTPRTSIHDP